MSHDDGLLPAADAELKQLVAAMCDGAVTPDERDRLQARLADEPAAMAYYVGYLDLHAELQWRCRGEDKSNLFGLPVARPPILLRLRNAVMRPTPFSLTMAALVMGLLITALAFISPPIYRAVSRGGSVAEPTVVAEVSRTSAAVWKPARPADAGMQFLMVGEEVELVSGLAEIQFHRGVRVMLEGPAVLRIAGDNAAGLERGKLVARVADTAHGFEVRTPVAKVRDLGTEFAIAVSKRGGTDLHVFQGKVEVKPIESGASNASTYLVVAGERLEISETGVAVRSDSVDASARFVQRMPPQANELRISDEYVQAVREAAPAIYWRFEEAIDGRVANEMSPDHALEVVGGVRLLPSDEENYSAVFGGSKQPHYMICRDADLLTGPAYTVELWCLPYTPSPRMLTMLGVGCGEIIDSHLLALVGKGQGATATGRVRYLHRSPPGNSGGTDLYSAESIHVGQWHHIVSVYDHGAMRLYVNGEVVESKAAAPLHADARVVLLGRLGTNSPDSRYLVGRLDEVAVYDRALNEAEVRGHHELVHGAP